MAVQWLFYPVNSNIILFIAPGLFIFHETLNDKKYYAGMTFI